MRNRRKRERRKGRKEKGEKKSYRGIEDKRRK